MVRSFAQHCFSLFTGVRQGCATLFFSVAASPAILSYSDTDADIATMSVVVEWGWCVGCLYCRLWSSRFVVLLSPLDESSSVLAVPVRDGNLYLPSCGW